MAKLQANTYPSPNVRMKGEELQRLIIASGKSWDEILIYMEDWWGHHNDIARRIAAIEFELEPIVMQTLLRALGAE